MRSSDVVQEVVKLLMLDDPENAVVLCALVVVVVLLELWPVTLGLLLLYRINLSSWLLPFSSERSWSSSGSSHRWMNCFILAAYLRFMLSVLAGFSVLRKRAKSLSMVSFSDIEGYLSLFSLTSRKPRVTTYPRAYSMKEIESSIF